MQEQIKQIRVIIMEILSKMAIDADLDVLETADGPQFIIKTNEAGILIGGNGKTLISLNHVIKRIAAKKLGDLDEAMNFSLDVNDYQAKRVEELKNLARVNAQRVRYFKKEVSLKPMSSFERRIVHASLADYPDITTLSEGRDIDRHVVIKPFIANE